MSQFRIVTTSYNHCTNLPGWKTALFASNNMNVLWAPINLLLAFRAIESMIGAAAQSSAGTVVWDMDGRSFVRSLVASSMWDLVPSVVTGTKCWKRRDYRPGRLRPIEQNISPSCLAKVQWLSDSGTTAIAYFLWNWYHSPSFTELCKNVPAKFESPSKCSAAHPKNALRQNISACHSLNQAVTVIRLYNNHGS